MKDIEEIKKEIDLIKERNKKVEANKAWETSYTRKIGVASLTYLVILSFFILIKVEKPFISAIVPTLWFLLSTISLNFLKKIWIKNFYYRK